MIPRKMMYQEDEKLIIGHFLNDIVGEDRYLRFGHNASDEVVVQYLTDSFKSFGDTTMWFITLDKNEVVGTVHVTKDGPHYAEMGFTVSPNYRNQGIAQNLFHRGSTWAVVKGAQTLFTHCLSQNKVMQHIARKNGMNIIT